MSGASVESAAVNGARRIGTRLALIASLAIAGALASAPAALAADGFTRFAFVKGDTTRATLELRPLD